MSTKTFMIVNKKYLTMMYAIVILIVCMSIFYNQEETRTPPSVIDGTIDLSRLDLEGSGTVKLDGDWEFYWQQLLEPSDFSNGKRPNSSEFIAVPSKWNNYKGNLSATEDGYATYRLNVRLHTPAKNLAITIPEVSTAYNLYINGELVRSVGVVGREARESTPQYLPQIVPFSTENDHLEIMLQVSNFENWKGGIKSSLRLGETDASYKYREKKMGFDFFLVGIFFVMGIYHLGLYLCRTKDKAAFYFGLACLLVSIRSITTGEIVLLRMFPNLEWGMLTKLEFMSYYLAVPIFIKFIYHLYANDTEKRISDCFIALGLFFSGVIATTPVKIFSQTLMTYEVITLLACLYVCAMLVRAFKYKKEGADRLVIGVFIFLGTVVNDILFDHALVRVGALVSVGLFIFIFFQTLVLSTRFSRAYVALEEVTAELKDSNEKVNHILESIMDSFFALDHQARFTYINKEAERLLQKSQSDLLGKVIWEEFPGREESFTYKQYQKVINSRIPVHFEIFLEEVGLWIEVNAYPSQDGLSVFVRNIQERKQAADKIREYAEMLKEQVRLLDIDPDYTIERSLDGVITFWNHGAELGYHWMKEEAIGKVIYTLLQTQFPEPLQDINDELMKNGRWMGELIQTCRDGSTIVVRSCWLLKRGVDGKPMGVLEFNKDITEQKKIEQEMVRLDKLNMIGQMAAGISHEVRNPITTVRGFLQLLARKPGNIQYAEYYELMLSELDRAIGIINAYLSVARSQKPNFKIQDINQIFISLQPLLQADAFKIGKQIVFDLGKVPQVSLDDGEIRQLILNLCRNGLEAMAVRGETLRIATFFQEGKIVLSITDEGPGISEKMIEKLGTPFYSTKDNGTGLGLAICYGIVTRHKATIEVVSGSEGTTFLVKFAKGSIEADR